MKIQITLLTAVLLSAGSVAAQEETVTNIEKFALWDECGPMRLLVQNLDDDAAAIGLDEEDISVTVRSRLRSARIYTTDTSAPYLYINVTVVSRTFSVNIEYRKPVLDIASGEIFLASTWDVGSVGNHGDDAGYILSSVSRHTDRFIDEYLRVNEEACSQAAN